MSGSTVSGASGVVLRSRYEQYRWRDVRFSGHLAVVPAAVANAAARDPAFGPGGDFFLDVAPEAPVPAETPAAVADKADAPNGDGGAKRQREAR